MPPSSSLDNAPAIDERGAAAALWQRLRATPLNGNAWLALFHHYQARQLSWQAAYAARQCLRCDPSLHTAFAARVAEDGGS